MPRGLAEHTKQNIYCKAREEAGMTRYAAAEAIGISVDTLVKYEISTAPVPTETMLLMADVYRAPWLKRMYCASVCPVRNGECYTVDETGHRLATQWVASALDTRDIADTMVSVMRDGIVTADELRELQKLREHAEYVRRTAEEFMEWCDMKGVK